MKSRNYFVSHNFQPEGIQTAWYGADADPIHLRAVTIPSLTNKECNDLHVYDITPRMLCAGCAEGGKDACSVRSFLKASIAFSYLKRDDKILPLKRDLFQL